jgi:hypothetical protein
MPVEIKELHIRVTVSGGPSGAGHPVSGAPGGGERGGEHGAGRDEIVAECVEQVFQLLQARKER